MKWKTSETLAAALAVSGVTAVVITDTVAVTETTTTSGVVTSTSTAIVTDTSTATATSTSAPSATDTNTVTTFGLNPIPSQATQDAWKPPFPGPPPPFDQDGAFRPPDATPGIPGAPNIAVVSNDGRPGLPGHPDHPNAGAGIDLTSMDPPRFIRAMSTYPCRDCHNDPIHPGGDDTQARVQSSSGNGLMGLGPYRWGTPPAWERPVDGPPRPHDDDDDGQSRGRYDYGGPPRPPHDDKGPPGPYDDDDQGPPRPPHGDRGPPGPRDDRWDGPPPSKTCRDCDQHSPPSYEDPAPWRPLPRPGPGQNYDWGSGPGDRPHMRHSHAADWGDEPGSRPHIQHDRDPRWGADPQPADHPHHRRHPHHHPARPTPDSRGPPPDYNMPPPPHDMGPPPRPPHVNGDSTPPPPGPAPIPVRNMAFKNPWNPYSEMPQSHKEKKFNYTIKAWTHEWDDGEKKSKGTSLWVTSQCTDLPHKLNDKIRALDLTAGKDDWQDGIKQLTCMLYSDAGCLGEHHPVSGQCNKLGQNFGKWASSMMCWQNVMDWGGRC